MTFLLPLMVCAAAAVPADAPWMNPAHDLFYEKPATVWDEAFPLGNAILGALVWGDGMPLRISLDRTDLWDLRPVPEYHSPEYTYATMRQWEKEGRVKELEALYDNPYHRPAPTKIPAGRIELTPKKPKAAFQNARLSLSDATARADLGKVQARVWIHPTEPVGFIELDGVKDLEVSLKAPAFGGQEPGEAKPAISMGDLAQLGYPEPKTRSGEDFQAYEQEGWGGFRFAVHLAWRTDGARWLGAWSVSSTFDGDNPAEVAETRVRAALAEEARAALRASHEAWWRAWWERTWVTVPNPLVERQWYLETYKFGAAARRDAPPITLQGPWTADDGKLPPWKGDYHHDLNTQLSYWPCYSGNRLDEGLGFLEWLWKNRENTRDWTQRFFGMPGLNVPMTADLNNNQIGGWRQYTHSSTTASWLAHHFYLHWKFSQDRAFLEERAFPWLRDCAVFIEAVTAERGSDGKRTLPLSSSPEINDNRPEAWFPSVTNYDLALMRWLLAATAELADELKQADEAARWRAVLAELPDFALDENGGLSVAAGHPLKESHRHFSHLMALHPLGLYDPSQGGDALRVWQGSMETLDRLGTDYWCGYSFSWLSSIHARMHDGARAEKALETFARAFVLRNGFHCNGDQTKEGHSKFTYRPFTLEGNFAYAAGLQEMLLQSDTGVIEVFPAVPDTWKDARFKDLRAQGAFTVSAERRDGAVVSVEIASETGAAPKLRCPWTGAVLDLGDPAAAAAGVILHREGNAWRLGSRV